MKYTEVIYAEMHNPFFLCGTNFGTKLDLKNRPDIVMAWDNEDDRLVVWFKGISTDFPKTSVAHFTAKVVRELPPFAVKKEGDKKPHIRKVISAQVSTPQSHVHEGPGAGKV